MLDVGKTPPVDRRNHLNGSPIAIHLENAIERPDLATPTADLPLYRWFADGLTRLIACERCYVAILSPRGERIDEVRTGCPVADRFRRRRFWQLPRGLARKTAASSNRSLQRMALPEG
ncbi:hypothetical protein JQ634_04450 [Bradyrhizobium sp. AUGA SZCCT0240]|uniref:hypothetical protein n=1 Tax=unclassified Bradyrhizobium TaxID=2631580 RepID=UPI001BACB47B|nr:MULTISPECIES: hypothetical protein [unclassified Bradyrhizobium]MBR1195035.1 hypothetical protein [Bradyrhizobium sp. AUGA SZCCT0158]MBR1244983.1 hypothetical protein [Bradyrhizobium sp. AUGA SZCCT0274]MBR1252945.1 hypothetical protein [Bradyrhizobium sp. AUGA SZCCT0240]